MLDMRIELAVLSLDINGDSEGILHSTFIVDVMSGCWIQDCLGWDSVGK